MSGRLLVAAALDDPYVIEREIASIRSARSPGR
jgi:hypothetical protein